MKGSAKDWEPVSVPETQIRVTVDEELTQHLPIF